VGYMEAKWLKIWKQWQEQVAANDEQLVLRVFKQLEVGAGVPPEEAAGHLYVSEG